MSAIIWTTTPWTLPANKGICVRDDIRYSLVRLPPLQPGATDGELVIMASKLCEDVLSKVLDDKRVCLALQLPCDADDTGGSNVERSKRFRSRRDHLSASLSRSGRAYLAWYGVFSL